MSASRVLVAAVRRDVAEHEDELRSLSRREALKWLEHLHVPRRKS